MGWYINPADKPKETWLEENGEKFPSGNGAFIAATKDKRAICLVDNGLFTAAGVLVDEGELEAFTDPSDHRPKTWYVAPLDKLNAVCPGIPQ